MSSKRQQTMAKMTRERKVKERRALKLEKKQAAAAARRGEVFESPSGLLEGPDPRAAEGERPAGEDERPAGEGETAPPD